MAKHTDWKPTENQLKALEYAQAQDYHYTIVDLVAAIDIARQTWYDWRSDPEFCAWWRAQMERYFTGALDGVYADQLKIARDGAENSTQTAAARFLAERFDAGMARVPVIGVEGGVTISFHTLGDGDAAPALDVEGQAALGGGCEGE